MKLRIFNVKYSPNLGDGLLSECLEYALIESGSDKDHTYSVDLAGRTMYQRGSANRTLILKILDLMPKYLRGLLIGNILKFQSLKKWKPHYLSHLSDVEAVIVGGGNLFTDVDLNFPTKLSLVLKLATERNLPVAIYGVGVGSKWTVKGSAMLSNSLKCADIRYISVRDSNSYRNFINVFGDSYDVKVVRDPGVLSSRYFSNRSTGAKCIGLCLTSAIAVRYHSAKKFTDDFLKKWFLSLIEQIAQSKLDVIIFTNGSPEDVTFAREILDETDIKFASVLLQPKDPNELVSLISTCELVASYRMHALIAAYSLGITPIAFEWDEKLNSFMDSVNCEDLLFDLEKVTPSHVASIVVDNVQKKRILNNKETQIEALENVSEMFKLISHDSVDARS